MLLQSTLAQPQMLVVSDLDDIFIPLPDDLLVNLSESRSVVEAFLDSLPTMFQDNVNLESAFGPALKAAFMVMVLFIYLTSIVIHRYGIVYIINFYNNNNNQALSH
jgi:hypothetical protein